MTFIPDKPFNDLPFLPPQNDAWEQLVVYRKLAEARAALAELKGRAPVIPNPKMLINTLALQEAKDSSSIENIFTTSDKLYKALSSSMVKPDPQTKEVLRYGQSLGKAWENLQSAGWSIGLIENIYRTIKESQDGVRDQLVFVGNRFQVVYTPPCCKEVLNSKLNNWIAFASSNDTVDPVIKMAMLHYQFEAIHPFSDGNGRTGRILNVLYLCQAGFLDQPILYLSRYINEHKSDYYRLLREVTEKGNWQDWILYMLTAVTETSQETLKKINEVFKLFEHTLEKVKTERPKIYSYELVEILFHQPYCKIGFLVDQGIAQRNTAAKYLIELEEIGILTQEKLGSELLYLNTALYELLSR